jgi:hypothetical protein
MKGKAVPCYMSGGRKVRPRMGPSLDRTPAACIIGLAQ